VEDQARGAPGDEVAGGGEVDLVDEQPQAGRVDAGAGVGERELDGVRADGVSSRTSPVATTVP